MDPVDPTVEQFETVCHEDFSICDVRGKFVVCETNEELVVTDKTDNHAVYYIMDPVRRVPNNFCIIGLNLASYDQVFDILSLISRKFNTNHIVAYSSIAGYTTYRVLDGKLNIQKNKTE